MTYRARTDVPDHPGVDHIIQRSHNLFPRRVTIQSMNLEHIDIRPQPLYTSLYSIKDMLPTQPLPIYPKPVILACSPNSRLRTIKRNTKVAFTQDDDRRTRDIVRS